MKNSILDTIKEYMSSAPVDVRGLCRALGIEVVEKKFPDNVSGSIEKIDGEYKISVNQSHSETRKRFTIAHELGHFMLHDDLIGDGIFDNKLYRSDGNDNNKNISQYHEVEANKFAASILMPISLIDDFRRKGIQHPSELAQKLGVSEHAMRIRLEAAA